MNVNSLLLSHYHKRKTYVEKNKLSAYRLYHYENQNLPVAIDIYQDNAVIHIFAPVELLTRKQIELSLSKLLGIKDFFYKDRTKDKEFLLLGKRRKEIIVEEYGNKFHVNLSDYLDTGLFLDHRETRKWIMQNSKGKMVLNTFAYTGSFSIYAAKGKAVETVSVDISKTYCEWIKRNFELNKFSLGNNRVYKMDTFDYFKYAQKKKLVFDIIIIDPPTFSRSKGGTFSVEKDHPKLIHEALALLSPKGFILFSNNCQNFVIKKSVLNSARITEKEDTIPTDFVDTQPHRCFVIYK